MSDAESVGKHYGIPCAGQQGHSNGGASFIQRASPTFRLVRALFNGIICGARGLFVFWD
jgi:hypothetical protein